MKKTYDPELVNLLSLAWHGSQQMIDHCLKTSDYVKIDDMYVDIGDRSPSIDKTLWCDDEKEIPDMTKQIFIDMNIRYHSPDELEMKNNKMWGERTELWFCTQYYNDSTHGKLVGARLVTESETVDRIRKATEEEMEIMNVVIREAQARYLKRLEAYWNKYSKNIRCEGYWVNR